MTKQTRSRLSTIASQVSLAQTIQNTIEPAEPLDGAEMQAFINLVQAREAGSWSQHDIAIATGLARQMVLHADLIQIVKTEGVMIEHDRKGLIPHPAIASSVSLSGAIKNHCSMLGLTASQRGIAGSKQAIRNAHEQNLRSAFEGSGASSQFA